MLQNPKEFSTAVQALLASKQQSIISGQYTLNFILDNLRDSRTISFLLIIQEYMGGIQYQCCLVLPSDVH